MGYTETNQLIDVFMGNDIVIRPAGEVAPRKDAYYYVTPESNIYLGLTERISLFEAWNMELWKMKYHTSWDWLMPVVEKIETIKASSGKNYKVTITGDTCQIYDPQYFFDGSKYHYMNKLARIGVDKKIDVVYNIVVEFINWYNSNLPTPSIA